MKHPATAVETPVTANAGPRILVVEDNPITRKSVRLALHVEGYRVIEVGDGASALEHLSREMPDLVLLDLLLPDVHGVDLLKQIRGMPGGVDIPVLAFSGFVSKVEEARVASAGFTDFLLKPVEPSRLVATVANFLRPQNVVQKVRESGRRLLLADDDLVQLKLVRLQFEQAGFNVETARDGADAFAVAQRSVPDVIVTDVLMPHADGFELCQRLRHDPVLCRVPLVMLSANYIEDADQRLGERLGASAFVLREQGFDALLAAVLDSLARPPPMASATAPEIESERYARIVRQLERQSNLRAACAQRNVVQSAILHELGMIADTLSKRKDLESALDEILAYCLDGAGLSKGILYVSEVEGPLVLRAQYGCYNTLDAARAFFGEPALIQAALDTGETLPLPSAVSEAKRTEAFLNQAQSKSALVVPMRFGDNNAAVLILLSLHRDLLNDDWLAFGRALASQIGQSLTLSRTFYRLAESEQRYRSLFEAAQDGIVVTDEEGRVIDANPAACALSGYPLDSSKGMAIEGILAPGQAERWPEALREFRRTGRMSGEFTYVMKSGTIKTVEVHGTRVAPGLFLNLVRDVSERKRSEAMIERLAYYDPLTGLPNRVSLMARLKTAIDTATASRQLLALLLINMSDFRDINDALGHINGDRLLIEVAERLQRAVSDDEMVARLSGDEFGVLLPRLARRENIARVVAKINEELRRPVVIADVPIDIRVAIGVVLFPDHGRDADTLFQRSDVALHAAKREHCSYMVYNADFDHHKPEKLALISQLREAIKCDRLNLNYQPKIDVASRRVVGMEALVRWPHPARGVVFPDEFIPIAEHTGLINPLTVWVLASALRQLRAWRKLGYDLSLAVNISARDLQQPAIVTEVRDLVLSSGVPPESLILEVTESAMMVDPEGAGKKLAELRALGVKICVDDFGIGHASLAYLRNLPIHQLKIDKSFVISFNDPGNAAIVRSTIDLAHNLDLSVTAEGVEDESTLWELTKLGCDNAQGYGIARPLPPHEVVGWLNTWH